MTAALQFVSMLRPLGRDRALEVIRNFWHSMTVEERALLAVRWGLVDCPACGAPAKMGFS